MTVAVAPRSDAIGSRTVFPYAGRGLTTQALDAALRLARAEGGTVVPVFLALVPLRMELDAPLPRQAQFAVPVQEAIEQRAGRFEVPIESRIERGRTHRHALAQMIEHEAFDRIVIAAASHGEPGFDAADVAWLLRNAPGEIIVLRAAPTES